MTEVLKLNTAFSQWVKGGMFSMVLSEGQIKAISWIVGAFKDQPYEYGLLPANTQQSLLAKGLVRSYQSEKVFNGERMEVLAIKLTYEGKLVATLLRQAGLINNSLSEIMESDRFRELPTKEYQRA